MILELLENSLIPLPLNHNHTEKMNIHEVKH